MQKIDAYDVDGNVVSCLAQWDRNITIYLQDDLIDAAYPVHFATGKKGLAIVVESEYGDGVLSAVIPSTTLAAGEKIYGYVYLEDGDLGQSILMFEIEVERRAKPSDISLEDTAQYVTYESILEEVVAAMGAAEASATEAAESAESAAASATAAAESATAAAESAAAAEETVDEAVNNAYASLGFGVDDEGYIYQEVDDE